MTLQAYFTDPLFLSYLRNLAGDPQFVLPGVFVDLPNPLIVNGQLWTIPFELACYVSLGLVGVLGGHKRPWLPLVIAAIGTIGYYVARLLHWGGIADFHRSLPGPLIVVAFLVGTGIYFYRDRLDGSLRTGVLMLVIAMIALSLPGLAQFVAPWPVAYATVCLGCCNPPRTTYSSCADYSYGVFLYGLPTEQTISALGDWARNGWTVFFGSVVVSGGVAALSWKFVERPALDLRIPLKAWETRWLARRDTKRPASEKVV